MAESSRVRDLEEIRQASERVQADIAEALKKMHEAVAVLEFVIKRERLADER